MSDLQNPPLDPPVPGPSLHIETQPLPAPQKPILIENPSWGGLEIIGILVVGFVALVVLLLLMSALAHRFLYPHEAFLQVMPNHTILAIVTQSIAYAIVIGFMVFLVRHTSANSFGQGIRWNWPTYPAIYMLGGVVLCGVMLFVQRFVPMPKDVPMDRLFRTPQEAWAVSIFGLFLAPIMEELFFRGFLYPVLARRLGIVISVLLTALFFGSVHALQLGFSWGPVFIISLVGVVLTTIRALTKSVATSWLIHFAYNGTIFISMIIATGGFRHMERISP